ncbi:MAG: FAD-dependent oxidoreductase [Kiritimatiellae bacterium]|nr:FAD-dependent oxidoreductase [Kiritimatiellia bacterium]
MPTLTINGKPVEVPDGTTILAAARSVEVHIPTLCHHDALSPYGACRVCLVEVEQRGRTELKTSCNNVCLDGMTIRTDTERVLAARRIMVELLLARAPDSERILELAKGLGLTGSRFPAKDDLCIMCGLCVRMCAERMGKSAVSFAHKGQRRTVTTPFDGMTTVCQVCGACESVCPTGAVDLKAVTTRTPRPLTSPFDCELSPRSPVYRLYPQGVPNWPVIDRAHCVHLQKDACGICRDVCAAGAIDFEQTDKRTDIEVGAVVLAPGFDEFMARQEYDYGYSRYPDVVSSMEFERILSASGPYAGHVQRPSDGTEPRKIAFLQCVGSRDIACRNQYCSSVCCMYAIKEAVIAKEHLGQADVTIYFMDMRAFGKDFDKYYERARDEYGVRFVRARVSDVRRGPQDAGLTVRYVAEGGGVAEDTFDMVVLSVGLEPPAEQGRLARLLGIRTEPNGFVWTRATDPLKTSRDGIYVAGAASGPKDIPETVTQASGAAAEVGMLLSGARGTLTQTKTYPPEIDVSYQGPRIGVFVCHCGINIGGIVDVPGVVDYARSLPNVVYAERNLFTCSQDTQDKIKQVITEQGINRVVVASCSPRTHEPLFQQTIREVGLNPHLFEMANIRDQCSWVHMRDKDAATEKSKDLLRMAVAKVRTAVPLKSTLVDVHPEALVIGGGLSGMTAALSLAEQGFPVTLVEKADELGGNMRRLDEDIEGRKVAEWLAGVEARVRGHDRIRVLTRSRLAEVAGFVGNYESVIETLEGETPVRTTVTHGVAVLATGGAESKPAEYGYGKTPKVVTQLELEQALGTKDFHAPARVVMIQCVGSREGDHPYCSRVCCSTAVKNAIRLKSLNPGTEVCILYRDIRTYGLREAYYQKARDLGVTFLRYELEQKPQVAVRGRSVRVTAYDAVMGRTIRLPADLVVLSSRIDPNPDNAALAMLFKVALNSDGFFLEAHAKLRPVDFATEGVYLCGLAHYPKDMSETIAQALAAAGRAATVLSKDKIEAEARTSHVNEALCMGCAACVDVCAYKAIEIDLETGLARVNEAVCKGCGACAATCRSGAIDLRGFRDKQILDVLSTAGVRLARREA